MFWRLSGEQKKLLQISTGDHLQRLIHIKDGHDRNLCKLAFFESIVKGKVDERWR